MSSSTRYVARAREDAPKSPPKRFAPQTFTTREEAETYAATFRGFADWGEIHTYSAGLKKQTYEEIQSGSKRLISMKLKHTTLDTMDRMSEARGGITRTDLVEALVAEEEARQK